MLREIIIDEYGVSLGKKSERLVLKKEGKIIKEYAIKELQDLIISNKCGSISIALLEELIQNGTQVHFVDYKEEPFVTFYTPALHGSVKGRREQLLSYYDERGVQFVKEAVSSKTHNQINTLKYFLKNRESEKFLEIKEDIEKMKNYIIEISRIRGKNVDEIRQEALSIEAHAAKIYWKGISLLLENYVDFPGRKPRSNDPVNMMLDYGYAILRARASSSIIRAGLEPYAGFLHVDRSGRFSLVLDFMEIFRPSVIDRAVVSLITKGHIPATETKEDGTSFLHPSTLQLLRTSIMKRLEKREEYEGKDYMMKTIIQHQTRLLASFFKGMQKFKGYVSRW